MQVYLQVVDATTMQGINSATITVVDANGNSTGVSTTPYNNGWFTIDPGNGHLVISAPGYQSGLIDNPLDAFSRNKPIGLTQQAVTTNPVTTTVTTPVTTNLDPTVTTTQAQVEQPNYIMWAAIAVGAYLILK